MFYSLMALQSMCAECMLMITTASSLRLVATGQLSSLRMKVEQSLQRGITIDVLMELLSFEAGVEVLATLCLNAHAFFFNISSRWSLATGLLSLLMSIRKLAIYTSWAVDLNLYDLHTNVQAAEVDSSEERLVLDFHPLHEDSSQSSADRMRLIWVLVSVATDMMVHDSELAAQCLGLKKNILPHNHPCVSSLRLSHLHSLRSFALEQSEVLSKEARAFLI